MNRQQVYWVVKPMTKHLSLQQAQQGLSKMPVTYSIAWWQLWSTPTPASQLGDKD
jgi:hypothetical protein